MAVEQITGHPFTAADYEDGQDACQFAYPGSISHSVCLRPMAQHVSSIGPHAWYGPASEGGSNEICHRDGCYGLRLAKIHTGFKAQFMEVPPVTEEVNSMMAMGATVKDLPHDEFANKMVREVIGFKPASEAVIVFNAYSEAVLELIRQKDRAYGGAWRKQGWMGNLARVMSKTARLENMLWRDTPWLGTGGGESEVEAEDALQTIKDLMALCAFMGANIEDGNRWGRG